MTEPTKVSEDDAKVAIKAVTYTVLPDERTTICQITLDNDFTVNGSSTCVAKENFDKALGESYSYENAIDEVWKYLGFRLAEKRYAQKKLEELTSQLSEDDCEGCKI